MKLSEMRDVLERKGIQLTKSLGQNFLHDSNQLRRIVETADLTQADKVLEIGPGLGALTELLVERAGEVLAIEKDRRLVQFLQERFAAYRGPAFRLLHDDALEHLKRERRNWSDWQLVSNLPYSVASPILVELAQGERAPQRMVVTVQSEVAKRLVAEAGNNDYGLLTVLVQLDFESQGRFRIPAGCFFPEPKVDSVCVCLDRRPQPLLPAEQREAFTRIVKRAFSQRRKMALKLLKTDWPETMLREAFAAIGAPAAARAEQIELSGFVRLAQTLYGSVPRP